MFEKTGNKTIKEAGVGPFLNLMSEAFAYSCCLDRCSRMHLDFCFLFKIGAAARSTRSDIMKSFLSFFFSLSDLSLFLPNFVLPSPVIELTVGTIGKKFAYEVLQSARACSKSLNALY